MQFVYDQTVRGINDGLSPQEIIERTTLPNSIAENRYTQRFHGELPYYIKGVYGGLIDWFGNDTVELHPLSQKEEATRLVEAMGGRDRVMTMAGKALKDNDHQWAAQLSTYV